MHEELFQLLKVNKIFSSVSESELQSITSKFNKITLKKREWLFQQGDVAESLFILASGKLNILMVTRENKNKTFGHLEIGDLIGELGAFGEAPRTMSIRARTDCVLYEISYKDFIEFCYKYPSVILASMHPVLNRVQEIVNTISPREYNKHLILIATQDNALFNPFMEVFVKLLRDYHKIILISEYLDEFNYADENINELEKKLYTVYKNKKTYQQIIYIVKSATSPLFQLAAKYAENIYLIAEALQTPALETPLQEFLNGKKNSHKPFIVNLILLHPSNTLMPKNTTQWLDHHPFHMHHHVRIGTERHFKRLLRFMRGRAVGLALSGGGTRGFAHIGAIKALRDQKVPIDFIGGTSVGAIVGACYAITESYQDCLQKFKDIVHLSRKSVSIVSFTWPIISLFDGKTFTNALLKHFDAFQIEDLWVPFFCISTNLADYREEVHKEGSLYEKVRASASVPGIIPPMLIEGEIHFDGGLLNNLPVDVMRQLLGKKAKIIAVELMAYMHDAKKYDFGPIFTLKQALLVKLGMSPLNYIVPRFVDTFFRGMLVGSFIRTKQNGVMADILVDLSLRKFRLLHVTPKQAKKMLEIGYVETTTRLHQHKNHKKI